MKLIKDIEQLHPYLEYAAGKDTAHGEYDPSDPSQGKLHNHCGCVAYVIQKYFGGEIVSMKGHYFNRIDGYEPIDATRKKYRFKPPYSVSRKVPKRKKVNPRFSTFYNRVEWAINGG